MVEHDDGNIPIDAEYALFQLGARTRVESVEESEDEDSDPSGLRR